MPSLPVKTQQPSPVSPQVEMPPEFPAIPREVLDRFPSAKDWQVRLDEFWTRSKQSIEQAQTQAANYANSRVTYSVDTFRIYAKNGISQPMFSLDATGIRLGDVLVINTPGRKVYIGAGELANDNTPFYIDTLGNFSLGASFVWDPVADTLTITGIINATSGTIGGFAIGADYIRDVANSMGLASTVTGGDDVRFWAGETFANRATAPLRITESGVLTASNASISGTVTASTVIVGYTAKYTDSTASNFQVINTTGQSNTINNFCFGAGTPNFEGWVAGGTITSPSQALSGRLMKIKLVTYGSGGGGWLNGGNASIWLVATEDQTNTARGTEIRFRTTANGTITEGYGLVIGNDSKLYIGPDSALALDTNLYRDSPNVLKTDDTFTCAALKVNGVERINTKFPSWSLTGHSTDRSGTAPPYVAFATAAEINNALSRLYNYIATAATDLDDIGIFG